MPKVNDSKKNILDLLMEESPKAEKALSGEKIALKTGISRVAVWKHIQSLKDKGYPIDSCHSGYYYLRGRDLLLPEEFTEMKDLIFHLKETDSTMTLAREKAENNCPNFTTIVAENQNQGRGRGDKNWESTQGGLYFTTVLRPKLPASYQQIITAAASALIAEELNKRGILATVKWPNDVYCGKEKIAGILQESHCIGDQIRWLNLGIGININNSPGQAAATSLKQLKGQDQSRKEMLSSILLRLQALIKHVRPQEIIRYWEKYWPGQGQSLEISCFDSSLFRGKACGLSRTGTLIVKTDRLEEVLPGDKIIIL